MTLDSLRVQLGSQVPSGCWVSRMKRVAAVMRRVWAGLGGRGRGRRRGEQRLRVPPEVPLVATEGNYLLQDEGRRTAVLPLLDELWYLDLDARRRVPRLVERHVRFGKYRAGSRTLGQRIRRAERPPRAPGSGRAHLVVAMS